MALVRSTNEVFVAPREARHLWGTRGRSRQGTGQWVWARNIGRGQQPCTQQSTPLPSIPRRRSSKPDAGVSAARQRAMNMAAARVKAAHQDGPTFGHHLHRGTGTGRRAQIPPRGHQTYTRSDLHERVGRPWWRVGVIRHQLGYVHDKNRQGAETMVKGTPEIQAMCRRTRKETSAAQEWPQTSKTTSHSNTERMRTP